MSEQLGGTPESLQKYDTSLSSKEDWPRLKDQLLNVFLDCFPQYGVSPKTVEIIFTKQYAYESDVVVLLTDTTDKKLAGFTAAHVYSDHPEIANIGFTGVISEKRGQK